MRILRLGLIVSLVATCCSCSWISTKPEVNYKAPSISTDATNVKKFDASSKNNITIIIKADPELNRYQNKPHALHLCIYQLKDPNGFNQLAEEKDGVPKLLECSRFDGTVVNAKRLVIQPGQELKDIRDKAEGARFVGIATGYYGTGKEKLTHLSPLSTGMFSSGTTINVELGSNEISEIQVK